MFETSDVTPDVVNPDTGDAVEVSMHSTGLLDGGDVVTPEVPELVPEVTTLDARKAARLQSAEQAEQASAKARTERAQRIRQDEERNASTRYQYERAQFEQERAQFQQQARAQAEAIRKGGPEALKALGLNYEQLTREWIDSGSPEERVNALQARLDAQEEQAQRREQEYRQQQAERHEHQTVYGATQVLERHAASYPDAYDLPENLQIAGISRIKHQLLEAYGQAPTYEQVFERLDYEAKMHFTEVERRRQARASRANPSNGAVSQEESAQANQGKPRTLNNGLSATKATRKTPMTEEEMDAMLLSELREALVKDSTR